MRPTASTQARVPEPGRGDPRGHRGSLTDEEAQQVAAYINSKPRPKYPFKERDYIGSKIPVDAVYYRANEDVRHQSPVTGRPPSVASQ